MSFLGDGGYSVEIVYKQVERWYEIVQNRTLMSILMDVRGINGLTGEREAYLFFR